MNSIDGKSRSGSMARRARRFWPVWIVAAVLLVVGVVYFRGRFHYRSSGCPNMNVQECDAAAEDGFEGGVQAFADRILAYPDCPVLEPTRLHRNAAASPDVCAELPQLTDESLQTELAALGGHPDLIAQITQSLVNDWSAHVDHPLDSHDFQRLLDNRMTTLGAVAGAQFDAAGSRRSETTLDDVVADSGSQVQTFGAFMVASAIASGAVQINADASDTFDPYIVDDKVNWPEVRDNPNSFENLVSGADVIPDAAAINIYHGQDNLIGAWEWTTGLNWDDTYRRFTD